MKKIDWKNIFERALWTFLEAALASLPVTIPLEAGRAAATSMLISAAAAGLSAVKTLIIEISRAQKGGDEK